MDLVNSSTSDLVRRRVSVHLQPNRRVPSISVPTSAGHTANIISPRCTRGLFDLEVYSSCSCWNRVCREASPWNWFVVLQFSDIPYWHIMHHIQQNISTGIQTRTRCSGSQLLPPTSLIHPRQNIISDIFISLLWKKKAEWDGCRWGGGGEGTAVESSTDWQRRWGI